MKQTSTPDYLQLALGDGTPKKALMTAIVVGTILTIINHGDEILKGESFNYIKIILNLLCSLLCHLNGANGDRHHGSNNRGRYRV